jgi:hypothetical protein
VTSRMIQTVSQTSMTKKIILSRWFTTTRMRMRHVGHPSRDAIQARMRGPSRAFNAQAARKTAPTIRTW